MGNTKASIRRSIKSSQLNMREIVIFLDQATDAVTGPDRLLVDSIVDLGAGNHQIILDGKARATYGKAIFLKGYSSTDADVTVEVTASDAGSITVQARQGGAAADSALVLTIGVQDWKFEYKA